MTSPTSHILQSSVDALKLLLDQQATIIECLYGVSITNEEFEYLARNYAHTDLDIRDQFRIISHILTQYGDQYQAIQGFITQLREHRFNEELDEHIHISTEPVTRPDPDVLARLFGIEPN